MSVEYVELIPHTSIAAARDQFERLGHVGLHGVYDPALAEAAIRDADTRSLRPHHRDHGDLGETVATLRPITERGQPALHAVLQGIQQGVNHLGRDITPSSFGEKPLLQLITMEKNTSGPRHVDADHLADVVGIATLRGESRVRFDADGTDYTLRPGDVVIHDLERRLPHWGYTTDHARIGLAIAKRAGRFTRRTA